MTNNIIEDLVSAIAKLPGLGPRVARRIVLNLAKNKDKTLANLIYNLENVRDNVFDCKICGNLDAGKICSICLDENRDNSIICVVEEVADLWAIERANNFKGKYHILGGNLSATSGKTIEDLAIDSLFNKLHNNSEIKEVIIATSATLDGQSTAHFIEEMLKDFNINVTRLSYGIPMGSELDYLDDGTISIAFKARK